MVSVTTRNVLFWSVCIPTRLYLASRGDDPTLRLIAAVVSYRWMSDLENGHEGLFGGRAFWADERPLHGLLWGAYAVTGRSAFLYADTIVGIFNWAHHYLT